MKMLGQCTILFVVLIAMLPLRSASELQMLSVSAAIQDLATTTLGVERMQGHYNSLIYSIENRNATAIADLLARQLEGDFNAQREALLALKKRVELLYSDDDTVTIRASNQCCNMKRQELSQDFNFPVNVSMTMSCDRVSADSGPGARQESLSGQKLEDVYINNYQYPLKWQYFGSETGVSNVYPAFRAGDCTSYDVRFRPWYTASATPNFKDVVVVVKNNKFTNAQDHSTLLKAANILINTLNPRDRLAVLMYNSGVHRPALSGCYASSLSTASPANIVKFQNFLLTAPDPLDGNNLLGALKAAYDYLRYNNDDLLDHARDRAIAVFTDGERLDSKDIVDNISSLVTSYKPNNISLFIFIIVPANSFISTNVRRFYESLLPAVATSQSHYIELTHGADLRNKMRPFYSTFSTSQGNAFKPIFIPPYYKSGLDQLVSSLCTPCFKRSSGQLTLVGVAGVDLSLSDVLAGVEYLQDDPMTYAFIVDQEGLVLVHPLLPKPTSMMSSVYLHIETLERAVNFSEVVDSMTRGEVGCKLLRSLRTLPQGNTAYEGVDITTVTNEYCWRPISGTPFFLCVVNPVNIEFGELNAENITIPIQAQYHRLDLLGTDMGSICSHFNSRVNQAYSTVHLSPKAFEKPNEYLLAQETVQTARYIQTAMQEMSDPKQLLRTGILKAVAATAKVNSLWTSNQSSADYIAWRYIATPTGVMRVYPGVQLASKDMAITEKPWYKRAVTNLRLLALSTPHPDVLGTRNVITFSQAIIPESCNAGTDDYNCSVFAVMGMDVTYPSFIRLVNNNTPLCQDSSYRCLVIDGDGYLIAHESFDGAGNEQYVHISDREPLLSQDMYLSGYLKKTFCYSFQYDDNFTKRPRRRYSYEVTSLVKTSLRPLRGGYSKYCVFYSIAPIDSTNAYLIVVDQKKTDLSLCSTSVSCSCNVDWPCSSIPQDCTCPCYDDIPPNNYNPCQESFQDLVAYVCPAASTTNETVLVTSSPWSTPPLPSCSELPCDMYSSDFSDCTYFSDCQFCSLPTSNGPSEHKCLPTCPTVTTTTTTTVPTHSTSSPSSYITTAMVATPKNYTVTVEVNDRRHFTTNHTSLFHLTALYDLQAWKGVAIGLVALFVAVVVAVVIGGITWRQRGSPLQTRKVKMAASREVERKEGNMDVQPTTPQVPGVINSTMRLQQPLFVRSQSISEDCPFDSGHPPSLDDEGARRVGSVSVESLQVQHHIRDVAEEGSIDPSHAGGIWF